MARYRDTFGSYDTGAALPSRWTALDSTNATFTVATDAGSEGGQVLEIAKSGAGKTRITFNAPGSGTAQDIVARFEVSGSGLTPELIINSTGAASSENEYVLRVSGDDLVLDEATSGTYAQRDISTAVLPADITTGTEYAMRLRRVGTTIYGRIWRPAAEIEPAEWHVEYTDASARSAGGMGIGYSSSSGTMTVHYVSAGTAGDCGCELADEDLPLVGPHMTSSTDGSLRLSNAAGTVHAVIAIFGDATAANIRAAEAHYRDREFYVAARAANTVYRIDRFGLRRVSVITSITDPYGVAVDSVADDIYVSGRAVSIIYKSDLYPLSASAWKTPGGSNFPGYIYVDADNDRIYWADHSGVYAADPDGTNEVDFDTLSEELAVTSDGTTVYAADYTSTGGVYTKPVASPGDSWTAADTTSIIESLALNGDKDELYGAESVGGTIVKWTSLPPSAGNRTTFATLDGARYVGWFDFTEEAWPEDALIIANWGFESDGSDDIGGNDLTGVNTPTHTTGRVSNAATFDAASSEYYQIANASAGGVQPGVTAYSWMGLVKDDVIASPQSPMIRFGAINSTSPGINCLINSSGQVLFRYCDGTTLFSITSNTIVSAGVWAHVACSVDPAGIMRAWVNGVLQSTTVDTSGALGTDVQSTEDFRVAGLFNSYFDGQIDELRLFRRVLTQIDVSRDYNARAGRALSAFQTTGYPQIARQASAFSNNASVTDLSVTAPDGVTAGDLLLLITSFDGGPGTIGSPTFDGGANDTTSASFTTEISDNSSSPSYALYSKTAVSADADQSSNGDGYNVAWSSIQGAAQTLLRITGHDGINAISARLAGSGVTDPVSPGVTTTVPNCLVLEVMMVDDSAGGNLDVTAPDHSAVILNEYHAVPGATGGIVLSVAARHQATAGDTGAARWTLGSGRAYVSYTVAIAPEATGGTVSGSLTQGTATAGGVVDVLVQASGTLTQGASTLTGEAAVTVQASGSLTQGASTLAGEAGVIVSASGSLTQGASTAIGTIGTPTAEVSGSLTQGAATLSAEASVLVQVSGTLTQGVSTLTGAATVTLSLSGSITQGGQVLSGSIADPNNQIADIELSAAPLFGIAFTASPKFNIALSAEPKVE